MRKVQTMNGDYAVKVLSTTGFKSIMEAVSPEFQSRTGRTLVVEFGPSSNILSRIHGSEVVDVVIIASDAIDEMISQDTLVAGSRLDVAESGMAVAILAGAEKPDISSAESFKRTLLMSKSIALSNPAGGGRSGIAMQRVIDKLGIKDVIQSKIVYGGGGPSGLVASLIAKGAAEIGIQQKAELMLVPGVDIVGPLPDSLQETTTFAIGIPVKAMYKEAGRHLADLLRAEAGAHRLEAAGLKPVR